MESAHESIVTNDTFREIFQGMSEGIIMVEQSGNIISANPIAERIFGYEPGELNGMMLEDLLPERYRVKHVSYRKGFATHPEPRRMGLGRDLTALHKNGTEFPVEISLSYTQLKDKLLVMAFISDISQRKKAEEALRRSEEQLIVYAAELEKKVEARTEALHKTIKELEREIHDRKRAEEEARKALEKERELNELKSKFVSLASHEFRTPLTAVLSSASLISQYNDKGESDKIGKHVNRIKSSVNHLTSILNDFLSLGKLEEGKIEIKKETMPIAEFLEEVMEEIHAILKDGQRIIVECEPGFETINTDGRILRNVLINLLSNASKYSDAGKSIWLRLRRQDTDFVIEIQDEGIGIPRQDQKHMFDRFFRASNAGNIPGTGLGLNIVRRYVEFLNGNISFQSEYEKGSIFTLRIPNG